MFGSSKFDKSGLKSGSHIRPGPDLAGFEKKTAGFRSGPGPDMISGATNMNVCLIGLFTLVYWFMWWHVSHALFVFACFALLCLFVFHYPYCYVDIGGQHWWSRYSLWQPATVHIVLLSWQINSLSLSLSLSLCVCVSLSLQALQPPAAMGFKQWRSKPLRGPGSTVTWGPTFLSPPLPLPPIPLPSSSPPLPQPSPSPYREAAAKSS